MWLLRQPGSRPRKLCQKHPFRRALGPFSAQFLTTWVGAGVGAAHDGLMSMAVLVARRKRLPSEALFSGRTAAWLHGLEIQPCNPIEVTLPGTCRTSRLAGVALRRSEVGEKEKTWLRGVPATTVTRTIADLARYSSLVEAVVVVDMALHCRLLVLHQLQRWADDHPGFRGIGRLRHAVKLADSRSESPMETRLRMLLMTSGLPKPLVQMALTDEAGLFIARPDLYYPERRLAIEYDGANHRDRMPADNRRQNRLIEA